MNAHALPEWVSHVRGSVCAEMMQQRTMSLLGFEFLGYRKKKCNLKGVMEGLGGGRQKWHEEDRKHC